MIVIALIVLFTIWIFWRNREDMMDTSSAIANFMYHKNKQLTRDMAWGRNNANMQVNPNTLQWVSIADYAMFPGQVDNRGTMFEQVGGGRGYQAV